MRLNILYFDISLSFLYCNFHLCYITCVIFSGSGAVALAHLDGAGTEEAAAGMIARVQELALGYPEGRIELQLIGGFSDQHGYSEELFYNIMRKFFFISLIFINFNPK